MRKSIFELIQFFNLFQSSPAKKRQIHLIDIDRIGLIDHRQQVVAVWVCLTVLFVATKKVQRGKELVVVGDS